MSTEQQRGGLSLGIPTELVDAIAGRVANLVADRLPGSRTPTSRSRTPPSISPARSHEIRELKDQGGSDTSATGVRLLFRHADLDAALTVREPERR